MMCLWAKRKREGNEKKKKKGFKLEADGGERQEEDQARARLDVAKGVG